MRLLGKSTFTGQLSPAFWGQRAGGRDGWVVRDRVPGRPGSGTNKRGLNICSVSVPATFTLISDPSPPKDTLEGVFILTETLRLEVKKLPFFFRRGFWNTEKVRGQI